MKHLYTLLFISLFSLKLSAQLYQPFPTDSTEWRQQSASWFYPWMDRWDYVYAMKGDTVIGMNTYHKIYKTGVTATYFYSSPTAMPTLYYGPVPTDTNRYIGAIREDGAKHIYFYPDTSSFTGEQLLYDFNLTVGDTLPPYNSGYFAGSNYISSIDSILIGGIYHKRYHISNPAGYSNFTSIIEGIGSTFGLIERLVDPFEWYDRLICFTPNGSTAYLDPSYSSCGLPSPMGIADQKKDNGMQVFPNPGNGLINIRLAATGKIDVELCDLTGRTVLEKNDQLSAFSLDLSSYPCGVYFLKATDGKSFSAVQKIILQ